MKQIYSNFSGGINTASTKLNLGLDTKKIYAQVAHNIEILSNYGVTRANGNILLFSLNNNNSDIQTEYTNKYSINSIFSINDIILLSTDSGDFYSYNTTSSTLTLLLSNLEKNTKCVFSNFLGGVFVVNGVNTPFFFNYKENTVEVVDVIGADGTKIIGQTVTAFKSRLFVSQGSKLYFCALGNYNDFSTDNDAGYINNFHVDDSPIIALKPYEDYLAIYKSSQTYLLSGNNPSDFSIISFANHGAVSPFACCTTNNKQYFYSQGLFALSQTGELNQIVMSSEISLNIKSLLKNIDYTKINETILIPYETKNQIWCFIPLLTYNFLNLVFIYDYHNNAWVTREIPFNIKCATSFNNKIITADTNGNVYIEDFGSSFNGVPIEFCWKSPFLSLGKPNVRKTIEEFYLLLDESSDNNFIFSVYKDYDSLYEEDVDTVLKSDLNDLIWDSDNCHFALEDNDSSDNFHNKWSRFFESNYKLEISESIYSVQLCIRGNKLNHDFSLVAIDFKEILYD